MTMINNALTGAQAAQVALNTNSQNIANAATPGYTRQGPQMNAVQTAGRGANAAGAGVQVSSLHRFTDGYKNLQLWHTNSTLGQHEATQSYLDQLEQVMSDDTANVNRGLDNFFGALNAVSVQPDSSPLREQVVVAADALVKRVDSQQRLFASQHSAIKSQRVAAVEQLNGLTQDIARLNKQIAGSEHSGANTSALRDAREQKIDALAALVGVQVVEQADDTLTVSLNNGQPLVAGSDAAQFSEVDGQLRLKFANTSFKLPDEELGGQLGGLADYERQVLRPLETSMTELAGGLAQGFNRQLAAGYAPDGSAGQALFDFSNGKLGLTSITAGQLAFSSDPQASGNGDNLNALLALKSQRVQLSVFDTKGKPVSDGVGGVRTKSVVMGDVYTQLVGTIGVQSQQNQAAQTTAKTLRDQAKESWQSTSGVNSDEEAINLMQYRQLYSANMRVVQAANELFDSTLSMMN